MSNSELPRLFHIGTQKAGSTYIYNLLAEHPVVSLSTHSEVHFYTGNYEKGRDWYAGSFRGDGMRIDTSPKYFMDGGVAAKRIFENTKGMDPLFLLVFRNPIDYLHSHFQMHKSGGYFNSRPDLYPTQPNNFIEFIDEYPEYLNRALYAGILEDSWLKYFAPEQFKIVEFEDLIENTEEVMNDVQEFWGLPVRGLRAANVSKNRSLRYPFLYKLREMVAGHSKTKETLKRSDAFNYVHGAILTKSTDRLSKEERVAIAGRLKSDVEKLENLIDRRMSRWGDFKGD